MLPGSEITSMAAERVAVVVNPQRSAAADALLEALSDDTIDVDVRSLERPDDLADEIRGAVADGANVVAAVGGDGTQRTAAGVLRGTGASLAVVPGGTVNLLGQVLGIRSVDDSAAAIRSGSTTELDVGLVDGEPFVLTATSGFDAAVMHDVDDDAKRFGLLGYLGTGIRRLRRHRPRHVTVRADGEAVYTGRAMSVLVANVAERGSARFELAPAARPDDGRLDAVVVRCSTIPATIRAVYALLRGRRPDERDVVFAQGAEIDVEWAAPVWVQRDGDEIGRRARLRHGVAPEPIRLCVPPGAEH